jgi:hypothetical protein
MKQVVLSAFTFAVCMLVLASIASADIPQVINYQGRLCDSLDIPVPDGGYSLTFTMYADPSGVSDIWVCQEQTVQVTNGLFTFPIGDACGLPDDLFAVNSSVWLGISIDGGPESLPLTQIMAVAYAFHSLRADTAEFVNGSSTGQGWIDAGTVVHLEVAGDTVGVGTTTPTAKLDVLGAINTANWYNIGGDRFISDSGNGNVLVGVHAGQNNIGISNTIVGYDAGVNNAGHNNAFVGRASGQTNSDGEGNTFIGASSGTANSSGDDNTYVGYKAGISAAGSNNTYLGQSAGASATGFGNVYIGKDAGYYENGNNQLFIANSSTPTPLIFGDFEAHQVGMGTTSPSATFHAISESGTAIRGEAGGIMVDAIKGITASSGGSGVTGSASGLLGSGVSGFAAGQHGKGVYGHAAEDSSCGIYGLTIGASSYSVYAKAEGDSSHGVYAEATSSYGHGLHAVNAVDEGRAIYAEASGEGGVAIEAHGGWRGYAARFTGNVILVSQSDGETILELGEGLDYAEGFDLSGEQTIEPGTVVIIDQDAPGKLSVSQTPYDNKVAGIVAGATGANGLGSGVRLGGDRFDMDVALAGRVFCNVDATIAGIEPGDLLTTSNTPGYAMKAVDYNLARGAILGKAMQRLEKGQKGQILVLVTLQ